MEWLRKPDRRQPPEVPDRPHGGAHRRPERHRLGQGHGPPRPRHDQAKQAPPRRTVKELHGHGRALPGLLRERLADRFLAPTHHVRAGILLGTRRLETLRQAARELELLLDRNRPQRAAERAGGHMKPPVSHAARRYIGRACGEPQRHKAHKGLTKSGAVWNPALLCESFESFASLWLPEDYPRLTLAHSSSFSRAAPPSMAALASRAPSSGVAAMPTATKASAASITAAARTASRRPFSAARRIAAFSAASPPASVRGSSS